MTEHPQPKNAHLYNNCPEQPICKECQQVNCQCRAVLLKENKPEQPNTEIEVKAVK